MPQALDDILDSVVLITGTNSSSFGTGFAIDSRQGATWILTCAHVVEDVGGVGNVLVEDKPAEVLACGKPEEMDLAVLRVQGLDCPPLKLGFVGNKDMPCGIAGFADFAGKSKRAEPLEGKLGSRVILKAPGGPRVRAWKLWIEGKTLLESGYSGSPVVCATTRTVIAVASHSEYKGERGFAVSLAHLKDVWPELPSALVRFPLQTGGWLAPEQLEFLENLFQKPPLSDKELRTWCHEAMPSNRPFIPADANSLDLLEWLVERGQLAEGQVPLSSVLQKLLPLVDADACNSLEQCIEQTKRHFRIANSWTMPEPAPARAEGTPTLMLEIRPKARGGKRCSIQGWLCLPSQEPEKVLVIESLNLEDRKGLRRFIKELHGTLSCVESKINQDDVIIEFILPSELLSQPVEQWTNEHEEPLGAYLSIVVRSGKRLREPAEQLGWQNCWKTLLAQREKMFLESLCWLDESKLRDVRGKLKERACIALGFVPDLLAPPSQNAVLYLLHVGTSVALWPRREEGLAELTQQFQTFLANRPLKELPKIIRDMRYQLWSHKNVTAPCYHLTLLWDDPNRRPPKEFLKGPIKPGTIRY